MAAGDDQGQGGFRVRLRTLPTSGRGFALIQQDGVDVAFEVVDGDERQTLREGQSLGVGDAHQQRSGESRDRR